MTQDIGQTIKDMSEIEFPEGLHGKILRRILFLKFRTPFVVVMTLLILNLIISGFRIWERLLDAEAFTILSLLWETLEFNLAGVGQFLTDIYDVLPVGYLVLFAINLLAFAYIGFYVPRALNKTRAPKVA